MHNLWCIKIRCIIVELIIVQYTCDTAQKSRAFISITNIDCGFFASLFTLKSWWNMKGFPWILSKLRGFFLLLLVWRGFSKASWRFFVRFQDSVEIPSLFYLFRKFFFFLRIVNVLWEFWGILKSYERFPEDSLESFHFSGFYGVSLPFLWILEDSIGILWKFKTIFCH